MMFSSCTAFSAPAHRLFLGGAFRFGAFVCGSGLLHRAAAGLLFLRLFGGGVFAGFSGSFFTASAGGLLFFGAFLRVFCSGFSGAAGFGGFDFFVVLFGKNGVLTHVILKKIMRRRDYASLRSEALTPDSSRVNRA